MVSAWRLGLDGRFIHPHYPGIGRYTYNLARALLAVAPGQPIVLYHDPRQTSPQYDLAALARAGARLRPAPVRPRSPGEQILFPYLAAADRLDLFHAPYYVRPYVLPCASVTTIHDANSSRAPASLPSRQARWLYEGAMRLALRSSGLVLTVSAFAARDLQRFFRFPPDRVRVTPEAADPQFRPGLAGTAEAAEVASRLGLPERYLLYVGSNKPLKNLVRLIEAFAAVRQHSVLAGMALVLAGDDDPRYPEAHRRAAELGLGDAVRFLGEVAAADLPYVVARARLFVFPSLLEGFGLPPLEAMACGVPVVCSDRASLPEVCGQAARYFDPTCVEALAEAILAVVADDDLRREMSRASLEQARQFSWERTAAATLAAYAEVLG